MHKALFTKDMEQGTLCVERQFDVAPEKLWQAHTESDLLGQWWAPRPWRAVTVLMDFRVGGKWLYYMEGPEGERHYCTQAYQEVVPGKSFAGDDYFCDEDGRQNNDLPVSRWKTEFVPEGEGSKLISTITYSSGSELEKILAMGMEGGYTMALNQLEVLLAS